MKRGRKKIRQKNQAHQAEWLYRRSEEKISVKVRESVRAKPLVCMRPESAPRCASSSAQDPHRVSHSISLKLRLHHRRGSHCCKSDSGFAHFGVCAGRKLFEDDAGWSRLLFALQVLPIMKENKKQIGFCSEISKCTLLLDLSPFCRSLDFVILDYSAAFGQIWGRIWKRMQPVPELTLCSRKTFQNDMTCFTWKPGRCSPRCVDNGVKWHLQWSHQSSMMAANPLFSAVVSEPPVSSCL